MQAKSYLRTRLKIASSVEMPAVKIDLVLHDKYLLLTEFEGCTVKLSTEF